MPPKTDEEKAEFEQLKKEGQHWEKEQERVERIHERFRNREYSLTDAEEKSLSVELKEELRSIREHMLKGAKEGRFIGEVKESVQHEVDHYGLQTSKVGIYEGNSVKLVEESDYEHKGKIEWVERELDLAIKRANLRLKNLDESKKMSMRVRNEEEDKTEMRRALDEISKNLKEMINKIDRKIWAENEFPSVEELKKEIEKRRKELYLVK